MLSFNFPLEAVNIRSWLQQGRVCAQRRLLQPSASGNYSLSITSSGGLLVLAHKLQAPQEQGHYSPLKKKLCSECSSWRMTAESRAPDWSRSKAELPSVTIFSSITSVRLMRWYFKADLFPFIALRSFCVQYVTLELNMCGSCHLLFTQFCLQILNSLNLTWWQS